MLRLKCILPLPISQICTLNPTLSVALSSLLTFDLRGQRCRCQKQIVQMKVTAPSTSRLARAPFQSPLWLQKAPTQLTAGLEMKVPYLLSHLFIIALPCQLVLVLGSLQKEQKGEAMNGLLPFPWGTQPRYSLHSDSPSFPYCLMLFCFFTECFSSLFCLYPYLLILQLFYGSFILLSG